MANVEFGIYVAACYNTLYTPERGCIGLGFWVKLGNYFLSNHEMIFERFLEHISLSAIAIVITGMIAIPLGISLTRNKRVAGYVINIVSLLYTIPSLALFAFFISFLGIGFKAALVALIIYGLLPLVRNTYVGISEVDPSMIESAEGMGTTRAQRLFMVELPLAFPVILAGFRTMTVMTIALATFATFIGAGGLGSLILRGMNTMRNEITLSGAIPVALLAIFAELMLGRVEKRIRCKITPARS